MAVFCNPDGIDARILGGAGLNRTAGRSFAEPRPIPLGYRAGHSSEQLKNQPETLQRILTLLISSWDTLKPLSQPVYRGVFLSKAPYTPAL